MPQDLTRAVRRAATLLPLLRRVILEAAERCGLTYVHHAAYGERQHVALAVDEVLQLDALAPLVPCVPRAAVPQAAEVARNNTAHRLHVLHNHAPSHEAATHVVPSKR